MRRLYKTKEEILRRAQEAIGIPFRQIDKTGRLMTGKGAVGSVIEESWFGYAPNPRTEPDFPEAGVELKVTPYIKVDGLISAKERLVCNIIDYTTEYRHTFDTSDFWHKCSTMLIMFYENRDGVAKEDYFIDAAILFSFPEEDLAIIRHDWETIMRKVRDGRAHEISEGDTFYLAACTKGAGAGTLRRQPFSDEPAKQRAWSLKRTYMTYLLQTYVFGGKKDERIVKDWRILRRQTFEAYVTQAVSPFFGMTQAQLKASFDIEGYPKNLNELLLSKMLGIEGKITHTEEFQKSGIVPKTIRVRKDGSIKESMSFPAFDPIELSQETRWETSEFYSQLASTRFLFVIFWENDLGEFVFRRIKFWNMPVYDLDKAKRVWERTVETIRRGVRLWETGRGIANDLPKQSQNSVAHVRPHARNAADVCQLPDGRWMTKQSFWLNNGYIARQIGP